MTDTSAVRSFSAIASLTLAAVCGTALPAAAQCSGNCASCSTKEKESAGAPAVEEGVKVGDLTLQRSEWRASTFNVSSQSEASLVLGRDDEIIACWSSRRQQEGKYGVYAQRFDANGVAIGNETALGLWDKAHQSSPVMAADAKGGIWAAWTAHHQDGEMGSIIARRFDAELNGGSEVLVNQQTAGHQGNPTLTVMADGTALIVWTSNATPKEPNVLRGRVLGADGEALTDEFAITAGHEGREVVPSVALGADNTFAIAYSVFCDDNKPAGIRLQRLNAEGKRLGDEIIVSGKQTPNQIEPALAATADGYVVAWLDGGIDGDDYGVVARLIDGKGKPSCEPFLVNSTTAGPQSGAAIAVADNGRFAIAYNSADDDGNGIFAQLFTADGSRLGDAFRVNEHVEGKQHLHQSAGTPRLAFTANGGLICVWDGNADKGDSSSVNVTMLSPNAVDLGDQAQGVTDDMKPATTSVAKGDDSAQPHIPPTFNPRDIAEMHQEIELRPRGIGFTAVTSTGWVPPDSHMAVGPDHIVVMTNGAIAFYQKDGTLDFVDEIEDSYGFWGSVGATGFVFDPEVLYDELSGRFFAMAAEGYAPGSSSYALVAVSDDSDPNGTWHKYRLNTSSLAGDLFDSPNIGVDQNVMYITGDGFGLGANYPVFTYDKASLLAGNPPVITRSTTLSTSTQSAGIPPVSFDGPPAYYMVEHQEGSNRTRVRLIALTDPLGTITFTTFNLTVPSYSNPGDPSQQGTSTRPETFDSRFWSCAYRNGSLWATHHTNNPVQLRWYEIAMNGWPDTDFDPQLVQSGGVDDDGLYTFFTSITADDAGNAAVCFARSSSSEYISMATAYRLASDPLNTMRPMVIQKESNAPYTTSRWGDYSAVQVDPATGQFWAHHEYNVNGTWRTWVSSIDGLPVDCPGDFNGDGVRDQADLGQLLSSYLNDDGGDINGDGVTDQEDLGALLSVYGDPCP